jgi:hypothetical protein
MVGRGWGKGMGTHCWEKRLFWGWWKCSEIGGDNGCSTLKTTGPVKWKTRSPEHFQHKAEPSVAAFTNPGHWLPLSSMHSETVCQSKAWQALRVLQGNFKENPSPLLFCFPQGTEGTYKRLNLRNWRGLIPQDPLGQQTDREQLVKTKMHLFKLQFLCLKSSTEKKGRKKLKRRQISRHAYPHTLRKYFVLWRYILRKNDLD